MKKTSSWSPEDASRSQCTPSTPRTLAISCGSATTAVVPERQHEPRELVDHELDRLEVHVRVDEPGDDEASLRVERLAPFVVAEPRDDSVDDRDVHVEPLAREDGEDTAAADDEVGRLVPPRDCQPPAEVIHGATA